MSRTFTVCNADAGGWTNQAIQAALDLARAGGGGRVEVPAGVYQLHDAVHLRSGCELVGEPGTVLRKVPSVTSPIPDYLGYGHYEITVQEPEQFHVGMGIHILDDRAFGFYSTVATIVGIAGDRLFIDRMLNHDYSPEAHARAVSVFPLVEASGVTDVHINTLALDGNIGKERVSINGCRGGGVFIYQSCRVTVNDIEVCRFRGDAVSFQQCVDVRVEHGHMHDNAGGGIHPGSGSVRYLLADNHVHDNGGCGVFYCLRTTHSLCRNNVIERNGQAGISIGERDTDHVVAGNTLHGNGGPGITFRKPVRCGGDRVRVEGNTFSGNGVRESAAEIEIANDVHWLHLTGNVLTPTGGPAISVGMNCAHVFLEGNRAGDRPLSPSDVAGSSESLTWAAPGTFPPIGPAALPTDGARHLGVSDSGPFFGFPPLKFA